MTSKPCIIIYWDSVRSRFSSQKPAVIFKIPAFKQAQEGIQEETLLLNNLIWVTSLFVWPLWSLQPTKDVTSLRPVFLLSLLWSSHLGSTVSRANEGMGWELHDQLYRAEHKNTLHVCGDDCLLITKDNESHAHQLAFRSGLCIRGRQLPFIQELCLWSIPFPTTSVRQCSLTMTP